MNEVVNGGQLFREVFLVFGDGRIHFGLGFVFPFFCDVEAAFHFADRGVVLVESFLVSLSKFLLKRGCPLGDGVEDAAAHPEVMDAAFYFFFVA